MPNTEAGKELVERLKAGIRYDVTGADYFIDQIEIEAREQAVAAEQTRITWKGRTLFVEPGTNPGDPADAAADGFNAGVAAVLAIVNKGRKNAIPRNSCGE